MIAFIRRLRNIFSPVLAVRSERNMEEGYADGRELHERESGNINFQFFNICEREGIDSGINFLHEHEECNLYGALLFQNEEHQDTLLHSAIKRNNVDLTKNLLCILVGQYICDFTYNDKYFKNEKEREEHFSKVINTKNREGKDIITLVIEGDNPECISVVFQHLRREDLNREKDDESGYKPIHEAVRFKKRNAVRALLESKYVDVELLDRRSYRALKYIDDKETAKLFIKYYDETIDNLRKKLENSCRKVARAEEVHDRKKSAFACLVVVCFCALLCNIALGTTIGRIPSSGFAVNDALDLLTGVSPLMVFLIYCCGKKLSRYKEENSTLRKELQNCTEGRYKLEKKLFDLRRGEASSNTEANLVFPRVFQLTSVSGSIYSPELRTN